MLMSTSKLSVPNKPISIKQSVGSQLYLSKLFHDISIITYSSYPVFVHFSGISSPYQPSPSKRPSTMHQDTQLLQHPVAQLRGSLPGRIHHPDDAIDDSALFAALQELRHGAVPQPGWPWGTHGFPHGPTGKWRFMVGNIWENQLDMEFPSYPPVISQLAMI